MRKAENIHYAESAISKKSKEIFLNALLADDGIMSISYVQLRYLIQMTKAIYMKKKQALISKSEQAFFAAIKESLPPDYYVFPQINLASFIEKNDNSRYHNELFRNVDFLITSSTYNPLVVIEINDMTHMDAERKERDIKVEKICDEAGVKRITFWTSYGVNNTYIKEKNSRSYIFAS